ncbi:MAG: GDP-L-fucose synthase [Pseudomonadota bacterium]
MHYNLSGRRIWVAGHRGMVGSATSRALKARGDCKVLEVGRETLDLLDGAAVRDWLKREKPDAIVVAAAKVGGILANATYPATFLYDNLMIEANVIDGAHRADVDRLLFLGSTCIYPKLAPQPIPESALLTGPLEPTNDAYAIAKIAGIKLCQAYRAQYGRDYISAMPTNLYGPGDNFDLETSHVLPALIAKFHAAKRDGSAVTLWGSGTALREFLHADDLASALVFLLETYSDAEHINVGTGKDLTIAEFAKKVATVVGYDAEILFDASKPDGTPRKCTDTRKLNALGWQPSIPLDEGLAMTYRWYLENVVTDTA